MILTFYLTNLQVIFLLNDTADSAFQVDVTEVEPLILPDDSEFQGGVTEVEPERFYQLLATVGRDQSDEKWVELLGHQSISETLHRVCSCKVPCPIRAGLSHLDIYNLRHKSLSHRLSTGARCNYVAGLLQSNFCRTPSHHPARISHGDRIDGQRAKTLHYVVTGSSGPVDVCAPVFAEVLGVSGSLLRSASTSINVH